MSEEWGRELFRTGLSSPDFRTRSGGLGGLGGGFDLDAVDQQHINNLEGVVVLFHDHTATIPREGNEIGVWHFERAPVSHVQDERLKRLLVQNLANRNGIHAANLEDRGFGASAEREPLGADLRTRLCPVGTFENSPAFQRRV